MFMVPKSASVESFRKNKPWLPLWNGFSRALVAPRQKYTRSAPKCIDAERSSTTIFSAVQGGPESPPIFFQHRHWLFLCIRFRGREIDAAAVRCSASDAKISPTTIFQNVQGRGKSLENLLAQSTGYSFRIGLM